MYFSNLGLTIVAAIASIASISAAPMHNNSTNTTAANLKILNYALTLENLESSFYKAGLAKFNSSSFSNAGFDAQVRERFVEIGQHEADHVSTLTSVIKSMKGKPVPVCNYTFPMNNVTQFLAVAQALENTGVSAYLGVASGLSGNLSTAAATITTVEARHAAYLNELMNQTAFPYSFDTPLSPQAVVTIAGQFIKNCSYDLGVTPFNHLNASLPSGNSTKVTTSFTGNGSNSTTSFCQFIFGNMTVVSPRSSCALPKNADGYVYVVITDTKTPLTANDDSHILAGPALLFNGNHTTETNCTMPTNGTMPMPGNGTMMA